MAELKLPFIGHGGDYNPDQWRDRPDILAEDIRLMKLARCNLMSVGIFAWATLEHFQRTRGVLRLMAAVMVKGKTKVRFELSGYEEPLNRIFHFLRYTVLTLVALVLFIGSCILCTTDFKPILPNGVPLLAVAGIVFSIALAISGDQFLPAGFHGLDGKTNK